MDPPSPACAITRQTLPELALGLADGEERALALEHVAGCPECRRELEELSSLADELIALTPPREPPPGFENRVLERLNIRQTRPRPARRRLRRLAFAALVPAVAAATALGLSVSYSSDRKLASQYRAALQGAHGKYFQSARLNTPAGQVAGIVFAYQGSPSWLFYALGGRYGSGGIYKEQIVTRAGRTLILPSFRLVNGSWGIATPVPVRDIALVKLIGQPGGPALKATLPVIER
jgi:hypothetical protein